MHLDLVSCACTVRTDAHVSPWKLEVIGSLMGAGDGAKLYTVEQHRVNQWATNSSPKPDKAVSHAATPTE